MINKFPHLRSSTDPYGLMEQLAVAITIDPATDGTDRDTAADTTATLNFEFSWFGGIMGDPFTWNYYDSGGALKETADRPTFFRHYATGKVRFTAYEWEYTKIEINPMAGTGVVEGTAIVKAACQLPPASGGAVQAHRHDGSHGFTCEIVMHPTLKKWKIRTLNLKQK
jgi:hypothetical protein